MFGDAGWVERRTGNQEQRLVQWQDALDTPLVVVELGAGLAVPTVRAVSESIARRYGATLIRINPREAHGPDGTLSIEAGAAEALNAINSAVIS